MKDSVRMLNSQDRRRFLSSAAFASARPIGGKSANTAPAPTMPDVTHTHPAAAPAAGLRSKKIAPAETACPLMSAIALTAPMRIALNTPPSPTNSLAMAVDP